VLVRALLLYDAGACREPEGKGGLAHLVEHLMFVSSAPRPDESLRQRLRLHAIDDRGWTDSFAMGYQWDCLPEELPVLLEIEAERMAGLALSEATFERERNVVLREREFRGERDAWEELISNCYRAAYKGHPLGRDVSGTVESVSQLSLQDVHEFHEEYLRPGRAILVIEGPASPQNVVRQVRESFARVEKPGSGIDSVLPSLPPLAHHSVISDRPDFQGFQVAYGLRTPTRTPHDLVMNAILCDLLDSWVGALSSYSFGKERLLVVHRWYSRYFAGPEFVTMEVNADYDAQEALSWLWRDIVKSSRHLRNRIRFPLIIEGARRRLFQRGLGSGSDLTALAMNELAVGPTASLSVLDSILSKVDEEDCLEYFHRAINNECSVNAVVHGRGSKRKLELTTVGMASATAQDSTGYKPAPSPDPERLVELLQLYESRGLPRMERVSLPDQGALYLWQQPESQEVRVAGLRCFRGLRDLEASRKPGMNALYNVTASYASRRDDPDEEPEIYHLPYGTRFLADAFEYNFSAHGRSEDLDGILSTLSEWLNKKGLDAAAWGRTLRHVDLWFANDSVDAQLLAQRYRRSLVFGPEHPSRYSEICPPETYDRIKYKDISNFHKELASRDGLLWFASGKVDSAQLVRALPKLIERDKKPKLMETIPGAPPLKRISGRIFPAFECSDARVVLSLPAIDVSAVPNAWAHWEILRAMLHQQLFQELRERESLVYVVQADEDLQGDRFSLTISASTSPERAERVFSILCEFLKRVRSRVVEESPFLLAKLDAIHHLLQAEEDPALALARMESMARFGPVPENPTEELIDLDLASFQSFLEQTVNPDTFVFTVVGPILEDEIESFTF
jgi:zinc protease